MGIGPPCPPGSPIPRLLGIWLSCPPSLAQFPDPYREEALLAEVEAQSRKLAISEQTLRMRALAAMATRRGVAPGEAPGVAFANANRYGGQGAHGCFRWCTRQHCAPWAGPGFRSTLIISAMPFVQVLGSGASYLRLCQVPGCTRGGAAECTRLPGPGGDAEHCRGRPWSGSSCKLWSVPHFLHFLTGAF